MASNWDRGLPNLTLNNVRVQASSLSEAWKELSTNNLLRSVLLTTEKTSDAKPFDYQSIRCTVREIYDAIASTYGLVWEQDKRTGLTWFHPVDVAYDRILAAPIHVAQDQLGLPMQSGILEALTVNSAANIRVKPWGTLFLNTFNYAVDVAAGEYTVRDIINLCGLANSTKTFFAQVQQGGVFVTAVNLVSDHIRQVPSGALHLWDVEIGPGRGKGAPTREQLMTALANPDDGVRHAARNYLESIIWSPQADGWIDQGASPERTLWTCIGLTSVLVRSEETTHQASIETMKRLATASFLTSCEPGLALITALDLARLTKDTSALEVIEKRNLGANEFAEVASDACRIASLSQFVRKALEDKRADAIVAACMPVAAIVRSSNAGKLEFHL